MAFEWLREDLLALFGPSLLTHPVAAGMRGLATPGPARVANGGWRMEEPGG